MTLSRRHSKIAGIYPYKQLEAEFIVESPAPPEPGLPVAGPGIPIPARRGRGRRHPSASRAQETLLRLGTSRSAARYARPLSQIADEIIVRLAPLPGADVKITVEIEGVHGEGFDDATVRTISENSHTLHFDDHGFDD